MDPYLEIVIRSATVYLFLIIAIRFFGRKELTQLSTTDLVFIILISNSVQNAMVGQNSSLQGGLLAALVLFAVNFVLKWIMFRSPKFKQALESKPVILVHDGKLDIKNLHHLEITMDELEEAIREHGLDNYKQVRLAILEVNGNISILSRNGEHFRQTHFKHRRKQKALTSIT